MAKATGSILDDLDDSVEAFCDRVGHSGFDEGEDAGLVALARDGVFHPGARVLFVHTGGLPAVFGYEPPARIVPPTPPMV